MEGIDFDPISASLNGCRLYYPLLALPEAYAVLFKQLRRKGESRLPPSALRGLALLHSGIIVKLVHPHAEDANIAYSIIAAGWRDFFDAIIYATSRRLRAPLLTLDETFQRFLETRGFDTSMLVLYSR